MLARVFLATTGLALSLAAFGTTHAAPSGASGYASEVPPDEQVAYDGKNAIASDGEAASIPVTEELDFIKTNTFRTPFENRLKLVSNVDLVGTRYVGCDQYTLNVHSERSGLVRLSLAAEGGSKFDLQRSDGGITVHGAPLGLSLEQEQALARAFAFDSPVIRLEHDGHAFKPVGMEKLPGVLTWKIEAALADGYREVLYVDSHFGDVVRATIFDAKNSVVVDVKEHDYRVVDGIRVPFAIDYYGADGVMVANDRFSRAEVKPSGA